jgi:hypothetical protein
MATLSKKLSTKQKIEVHKSDSDNETVTKQIIEVVKKVTKKTSKPTIVKKVTAKKSEKTGSVVGDCGVCYNNYNHNTRKLLTCPFCKFDACTECVKKYLLTIHQDPHCMKCRTAWNRDFWMDSFPKVFINVEFKKHRELIMLDREKSLLPATMQVAERIKEVNRLKNSLDDLRSIIQKEKTMLSEFNSNGAITDDTEIYNKKKELTVNVAVAYFELDYRQSYIYKLSYGKNVAKQEPHKQFVRACPADGCNGMLSTQWKCGLCGIFVCHECHEIIGSNKDAPHTCAEENIATAKLLAKDTKPCPKCASLIFRISGCNQLFCTMCAHAFDWNTGKEIDRSILHNPHFFEYRATHADVFQSTTTRCGELPSQYVLQNKIRSFGMEYSHEAQIARKFLSSIYHNRDIEMRKYEQNDAVTNNEDLRIKFLLNEIDEDKFRRTIFFREKVASKKIEIYRVMELFDNVSRDVIIRLNSAKDASEFVGIWNEVAPLIDYCNMQMKIISKRYNHITPEISVNTYRWW